MSRLGEEDSVSLLDIDTGATKRDVAPAALGDYFTWGVRDGDDIIVTADGNYYSVDGDRAALPAHKIPSCQGIGVGDRPLVSKDAKFVSVFVGNRVVVRPLSSCDPIIDTQLVGAKADFSFDNRYLAFHAPAGAYAALHINVVDLWLGRVYKLDHIPGSSTFPSWTRDGHLVFENSDGEFHGFLMTAGLPKDPREWRPLPEDATARSEAAVTWARMFPTAKAPAETFSLVLAWSNRSAHIFEALAGMREAQALLDDSGMRLGYSSTREPGFEFEFGLAGLNNSDADLRRLTLSPEMVDATGLHNQDPVFLLFHDGRFIGRLLGAQSGGKLALWVRTEVDPILWTGVRHSSGGIWGHDSSYFGLTGDGA